MPHAPFPAQIDVSKLFAHSGAISAMLPVAKLRRLAEYLADDKGEIAVDLQFGHDEEGRRLLTGNLDVTVNVICQRCLQHMPLDLHSTLDLLVVDTDEELQALQDDQDGIVMENGDVDLPELIEDELILSLPLVPMHDDINCSRDLNAIRESADHAATQGKQNPFAVLAGLKDQGSDARNK